MDKTTEMSFEKLVVGDLYSKSDLSEIFENPTIRIIREGIYNLNQNETFFFVDLEKKGKEDRFHFDDFFEEDYFHWDSQTTQHINTPKIQEIVKGVRIPHLFVRVLPKIKTVTQPFVYCGRLNYIEYEKETSKPVHIIFQNIDYQEDTINENLVEVYSWKPSKIGMTTKSKISKKGVVSEQRKRNYKRPNQTERNGLITSRVGQGYYRQQIRNKWDDKCPITGSRLIEVLISSHIVPWSQCNDEERLDVENGILLSPNVDSLFDKHLISFSDEGQMLISHKISDDVVNQLGIDKSVVLPVSDGMKRYLKRHREIFYQDK